MVPKTLYLLSSMGYIVLRGIVLIGGYRPWVYICVSVYLRASDSICTGGHARMMPLGEDIGPY